MSRIEEAKRLVEQYHRSLQQDMNLPNLDVSSIPRLKNILERVYLFEHRCIIKKLKYSESLCIEFRGAIADLILLLENFDLQHAIATRSNNSNEDGKDMDSVA